MDADIVTWLELGSWRWLGMFGLSLMTTPCRGSTIISAGIRSSERSPSSRIRHSHATRWIEPSIVEKYIWDPLQILIDPEISAASCISVCLLSFPTSLPWWPYAQGLKMCTSGTLQSGKDTGSIIGPLLLGRLLPALCCCMYAFSSAPWMIWRKAEWWCMQRKELAARSLEYDSRWPHHACTTTWMSRGENNVFLNEGSTC
jgi:hypothetical protein